jgi:hypothetical protein
MVSKFLLVVLSFCIAAPTYAQIFRLNYAPSGAPAQAAIEAAISSEIAKAEADINKDLPGAPPQRLMEGMANSSVMAGKGIGSDYASRMDVLLIGAGVGAGADLEKDKTTDSDLSGIGVQGGLIIGTNLAWMDTQKILGLDTNRLKIYANFFKYDLNKPSGDTTIDAELFSIGSHVSYQWILGSPSKLFGWGGVQFHLGYEYNKTQIGFTNKLNETITATQGTETATVALSGTPKATITAKTMSIPLEVSTSLQFLYLFSLYGGLGADYNVGSATGKGDINSNTSNVNCTGVACGGGTSLGTVSPTAALDAKGKPSPFLFRGFAGFQLNLPFIRIFVQADKAFGNDLIGASTGLRFVY